MANPPRIDATFGSWPPRRALSDSVAKLAFGLVELLRVLAQFDDVTRQRARTNRAFDSSAAAVVRPRRMSSAWQWCPRQYDHRIPLPGQQYWRDTVQAPNGFASSVGSSDTSRCEPTPSVLK